MSVPVLAKEFVVDERQLPMLRAAGADVAMMTSAVLRNGPAHFAAVEADLRLWMERHEYTSVDQLRGSASQGHTDDPSAFERANYMKTLHSWAAPTGLTPSAPSA